MTIRLALPLIVSALVALATAALAAPAVKLAQRPVAHNHAERLASLPMDAPRYDTATRCTGRASVGARKLEAWLTDTRPRGSVWGIYRCWGKDRASLHAEGRALDWNLDVRDRADRREAERLIRLLRPPTAAARLMRWPRGWASSS